MVDAAARLQEGVRVQKRLEVRLEVGPEHVYQTLWPAVLLDVGHNIERGDVAEGLVGVHDKEPFVAHVVNDLMDRSRSRSSVVQKRDCTTNSAYVKPHHRHTLCRAPTKLRRNVTPPERQRIFGEIFVIVEGVFSWPHGNAARHSSSSPDGTQPLKSGQNMSDLLGPDTCCPKVRHVHE